MANIETIITENIDVWTSALRRRATQGRGSSSRIELYGIQKLRELILDLAVRGLLVPQDPEDEPASTLLKNVTKERLSLVASKKIRPLSKSLSIDKVAKPFNLPKSWCWAFFPEVCSYGVGKTPSTKNTAYWAESDKNSFYWVSISDMEHYKTLDKTARFISQKAVSEVFKSEPIKTGTLIMSFKLTLGKISRLGVDAYHNEAIISIFPFSQIDNDFIYRFLPARALAGNSKFAIKGRTLNSQSLSALLIPVPPLAEQKRIVKKVDELMGLCDQLEEQQENSIAAHQQLVEVLLNALTQAADQEGFDQAWSRIAANFETLFTTESSVEYLKQTILQLAVMGKLEKQDPEDEPASVLLERVVAEKERLTEEGKIRRQRRLPRVSEVEAIPNLPNSWEQRRIGEFALVGTGATPSRSNSTFYHPPAINWLTSGETSQEFIYATREKVSEKAIKETNVSVYPVGTLVVAMYGQGKTRGQVTELMIEAGTNQACAAIQLLEKSKYHRDYIKIFFKKSYDELRQHASGGAQPNLNISKISNTVVSIPPLAEQKRIVKKVEDLFAICDQFKTQLRTAQETKLKLADAITSQAVQ